MKERKKHWSSTVVETESRKRKRSKSNLVTPYKRSYLTFESSFVSPEGPLPAFGGEVSLINKYTYWYDPYILDNRNKASVRVLRIIQKNGINSYLHPYGWSEK